MEQIQEFDDYRVYKGVSSDGSVHRSMNSIATARKMEELKMNDDPVPYLIICICVYDFTGTLIYVFFFCLVFVSALLNLSLIHISEPTRPY